MGTIWYGKMGVSSEHVICECLWNVHSNRYPHEIRCTEMSIYDFVTNGKSFIQQFEIIYSQQAVSNSMVKIPHVDIYGVHCSNWMGILVQMYDVIDLVSYSEIIFATCWV